MEICSPVKQDLPLYSKHPLYMTWRMMNYRCFSDVHTNFETYGGAGITVCERWRWDNHSGLSNFIEDMGERPHKHTVDRKDPYGNYEPSNCRWADKRTQQNNFRKERDTVSGRLGVVPWDDRWAAKVNFNGAPFTLNIFDTAEEAAEARDNAVKLKLELGDDEALRILKESIVTLDNGKRPYKRKTSRYYGVCSLKEKWRAAISRRDAEGRLKQVHIGVFETEEAAHEAVVAYLEKEKNSESSV
jgi:hypothetical protein